MSARRRGIVLAGLALLLGALAASDVAGREAALRRSVGPLVDVVVAARALTPGHPLRTGDLTIRRVPARFAPSGALPDAHALLGLRPTTEVPAGADLAATLVDRGATDEPGAPVGSGERVVDVVAVGSTATIQPGGRVDVLVTRDRADATAGTTELALEDVEVLAVRAVSAAAAERTGERVSATVRVTLRQAVYLAAAQSFARELRLLPRAAGDRRHTRHGLVVDDSLAG